MTQVVDDSLEAGRDAARRHAWRDAYDLLSSADEDGPLAADDLESLGNAAWWTGRLEEAIGLRERAYAAFVEAGAARRAAISGGAFHKDDDDYAGQGVHMAARIGALAEGGEILVSRESLAGGTRFPLSEPRSEELKGFDGEVELVAVDWR